MKRVSHRQALRRRDQGVTLIELVAFIVIIGIVVVAMVQAFSGTARGSHYGREMTVATQLAQQRMEVILGQRKRLGFAGFTNANYDPCQLGLWLPTVEACSTATQAAGAFAVSSTFDSAANACGAGTGTTCVVVTVSVTGPNSGALTSLTSHIWDY